MSVQIAASLFLLEKFLESLAHYAAYVSEAAFLDEQLDLFSFS
jgi:hypothetical protein